MIKETKEIEIVEVEVLVENPCRVYWGSHGCQLERGHEGTCECSCCICGEEHSHETIVDDTFGSIVCVAKAPYYGSDTWFYGEDAADRRLPLGNK